jgi:alcohol dehydrogenase (cytochrome c)
MTVSNHIMVGTGNDLDSPGYLMSFDPETGASNGASTRCR